MVKSAVGTSEESKRIGSIQLVEVVHFTNYQDISSHIFFHVKTSLFTLQLYKTSRGFVTGPISGFIPLPVSSTVHIKV